MADEAYIEWRVSWTYWPTKSTRELSADRVYTDADMAYRKLDALRADEAQHELRPCDDHVHGPRLERRRVRVGPWKRVEG